MYRPPPFRALPRARRLPRARLPRAGAALALPAISAGLLLGGAPAPASAVPVPPSRAGLTSAIEAPQPFVGQRICDPVSKPGVVAFRDLVTRTYAGTGNLGIVRDCGIGGASEHKEGRAWDWAVSAHRPTQAAQVDALTRWLTATDRYGNRAAMARRTGVMYMIWNKRIWKAYAADRGWQPYTGPSPHTDHVHFSFGWAGAKKRTSYWDGTVAGIDHGPGTTPPPAPEPPAPRPPAPKPPTPKPPTPKPPAPQPPAPQPAVVRPERVPANLTVVARYGTATLRPGAQGEPVRLVQQRLRVPAPDGRYGRTTETAVRSFQRAQRLPVTGVFGRQEWPRLFPAPVVPFGAVTAVRAVPGAVLVTGWAVDADTPAPVLVGVNVNGASQIAVRARLDSPEVTRTYPTLAGAHGFATTLQLPDGVHSVCGVALNAPGTPGGSGALGCRSITVRHAPTGALDRVTATRSGARVTGWALDTDTAFPVTVRVTVNGRPVAELLASASRADVAARFPDFGAGHGLVLDLPLGRGEHRVCATALNASGTAGGPTVLGCADVEVERGDRGRGRGRGRGERDDD